MKTNWYSVYGTGAMLYGIVQRPDGRVEFTAWLCLFWMPLVPVSSWSARYIGESVQAIPGETHWFADLKRIPHDRRRQTKTFLSALLLVAAAIAPIWFMIERTSGRAATTTEMIIVLACTVWAGGLPISVETNRAKKLRTGSFKRVDEVRELPRTD
jgi:hypothetical protein